MMIKQKEKRHKEKVWGWLTMNIDSNNTPYDNVLFGYMCVPTEGLFGEDDGGFSLEVLTNGRLVYKTYIFSEIENTRIESQISPSALYEISMILEKHQKNIKSFKKILNNGSCDGYGNYFIFFGKQYITWNISFKNEIATKILNPIFYKRYKSVIRQENQLLRIFADIAAVLGQQGIHLKIEEVSFDNK